MMVEQMFEYKVGDLVICNWEYHAGQRGKVVEAKLMAGYPYYLVALPEADPWLAQESLQLA